MSVPSAARLVVFIHIPKTAGTTLKDVLRRNAPHSARLGNVFKGGGGRVKEPYYERKVHKMCSSARSGLFWGHTPFALASYLPPEWEPNFITFLRDPVERAISHYYALINRPRRDTEASDSHRDDKAGGSSRNPNVIWRDLSPDVAYEIALADDAFISDNLHTRMLCGLPEPFGEVTDEMLERAIENLGRFRCVGLAERFDESLVLLKRRIGYQSILYDDQRVNTSRPREADVPEELRRAAEKANTFDRELYRHAVALFESAPELGDLDFRIDLAALRSSRAGREAPLPDPPPELGLNGQTWPALLADRRALLGGARTQGPNKLQSREDRRKKANEARALRQEDRRKKANEARALRQEDRRKKADEAQALRLFSGAKAARGARGVADATDAIAPVKRKQKAARDPVVAREPKVPRSDRPGAPATGGPN